MWEVLTGRSGGRYGQTRAGSSTKAGRRLGPSVGRGRWERRVKSRAERGTIGHDSREDRTRSENSATRERCAAVGLV